MLKRPLLVIGDLHLGPAALADTECAAVELLERYPQTEWLCLGDLFDLSADCSGRLSHEAVHHQLDHFASLSAALRAHLRGGGAVTLIVGNHDAELAASGIRTAILRHLDLPPNSELAIEPWWTRRGGIHLEHGHVWDPDNAPIHPLVATRHHNEPLGVALTRRVLAPTGAFQFAHAHQTTPLTGLMRALRELRLSAPEVIARYFVAGLHVFWQAANHEHDGVQREGTRAIARFALAQGLDPKTVERVLEARPVPRHADPAAAFARLYLDRAAATVAAAVSSTLALTTHSPAMLLVAAAGVLYLGGSRGNRAHRYSASLLERVQSAALGIGPIVGARAVVFGHTHVAQTRSGYLNAGAFGFPSERGRPFLSWQDERVISRGWLRGSVEMEPLGDLRLRPEAQ